MNAPRTARLEIDGEPESTGVIATGVLEAPSALVGGTLHVDIAGRSVPIRLAPPPDEARAARAAAGHGATGPVELVAPMPGAVLAVHHAAGDTVEAGEPVVTLEAMKMEHVVAAPRAGTVREIAVREGEQVSRGQRLASVE